MSPSVSQNYSAAENPVLRLVAPVERSPMRLIILGVVLAIWVITLVVVYFNTVRPRHHALPTGDVKIVEQRDAVTIPAR